MNVKMDERRRRRILAALVVAAMAAFLSTAATRSQQRFWFYTWPQLSRMEGVAPKDFPRVVGSRTVRARFDVKRTFTVADGSLQTLSLFRAEKCWLEEKAAGTAIKCDGKEGPKVYIPVLFMTPASKPDSDKISDRMLDANLVIEMESPNGSSPADLVRVRVLYKSQLYDTSRGIWIKAHLTDSKPSDGLTLAAPVALVLCVPSSGCSQNGNGPLANLVAIAPAMPGAAPTAPQGPAEKGAPPADRDQIPPPGVPPTKLPVPLTPGTPPADDLPAEGPPAPPRQDRP